LFANTINPDIKIIGKEIDFEYITPFKISSFLLLEEVVSLNQENAPEA